MATRGSDFSQFSGAQAFIDNMLQGENIRRARQEAELNQQVLQEQLATNEVQRRQAEYNLGRAPIDDKYIDQQRQVEQFNLNELLRNAVAEGTMPSEGGSFGQIADVSKALPGLEMPMREISYGDMIAQGPFGKFTLPQSEGVARRKAGKRKLELDSQESIAKQAGTFLAQAQAQENRLQLEQLQTERAFKLEDYRFQHQKEIEKAANDARIAVARINQSKGGNATGNSRTLDEFQWAMQGSASGDLNSMELKRLGWSPDEINAVMQANAKRGYKNISSTMKKDLMKHKATAATLFTMTNEYRQLASEVSTNSNLVANLRGLGEEGLAAIGFPSETMKKFQVMQTDIRKRVAEHQGARASDKDAAAEELSNVKIGNTLEENLRRIDRMENLLAKGTQEYWGVNDEQFQDMFAGTGMDAYIARKSEANQEENSLVQQDQLELEAAREDYRNRLASDPATKQLLIQNNITEEEALRRWDKANGYGGN